MQADRIFDILGTRQIGSRKTKNIDVVEVIREGLPAATGRRVIEYYRLSDNQAESVLGFSLKTLKRRATSPKRRLSSLQSDRIYRLARIGAHAEEVFGESNKARDWMRSPNRVLKGTTPMDLLDTDAGAEQVDELLTSIEYGIFS